MLSPLSCYIEFDFFTSFVGVICAVILVSSTLASSLYALHYCELVSLFGTGCPNCRRMRSYFQERFFFFN
jgi:hypothetical protein